MRGWAPSYKRVAVTWSYEHTDGTQQTIEIELTPQNSTEGARECAAHALNGLVMHATCDDGRVKGHEFVEPSPSSATEKQP